MYKIIFGINEFEKCINTEEPWICIYKKFDSVFESSIGKMINSSAERLFHTDTKKEDLDKIRKNLRIVRNEENYIKEILKKCIKICPPKKSFSVYFLPVPSQTSMIITQHSKTLGTFIFFGVGIEFSHSKISIFLPHEYAHVIRLQNVLLPKNIDSPYTMTVYSLSIFEGLGVAFSMIFNNELDMDKLFKYIEMNDADLVKINLNKIMNEFESLKNERITPKIAGYLYGNKKIGYIAGTNIILSLIHHGEDICQLNSLDSQKILNLYKQYQSSYR